VERRRKTRETGELFKKDEEDEEGYQCNGSRFDMTVNRSKATVTGVLYEKFTAVVIGDVLSQCLNFIA